MDARDDIPLDDEEILEAIEALNEIKSRIDTNNEAPCPFCAATVKKVSTDHMGSWSMNCECGWSAAGKDRSPVH